MGYFVGTFDGGTDSDFVVTFVSAHKNIYYCGCSYRSADWRFVIVIDTDKGTKTVAVIGITGAKKGAVVGNVTTHSH